MHLVKTLLATWACLAQVSLAGVAFTKWPTTVYTGKPATMYWKGDPDTPVTVTLRRGPSGNLKTLKVLTTEAQGGSFTWVPEESLAPSNDYALQIEQDGSINYSGLITLAPKPGQQYQQSQTPAVPQSSPKNTPLPLDTNTPLGGARPGVQKGNNGFMPTLNSSSARLNMTSGKSTAPTSSDGVSLRYVPLEITLAGLAALVYFAA
ncbi:hypothetical protein BDV18DRAFT_146062 [Aspergillus unguis]